jgi:hypothetical protein
MNNRNFENKTHSKKYNEKYAKTGKQPQPKLPTCKICHQKFNIQESFDKKQCSSCYNALFYYLYINMHFFVERD